MVFCFHRVKFVILSKKKFLSYDIRKAIAACKFGGQYSVFIKFTVKRTNFDSQHPSKRP